MEALHLTTGVFLAMFGYLIYLSAKGGKQNGNKKIHAIRSHNRCSICLSGSNLKQSSHPWKPVEIALARRQESLAEPVSE
jgi:hypothetical protein